MDVPTLGPDDLRYDAPVYYNGRLWDAPFTDGAISVPEELAEALFNGPAEQVCIFCEEPMMITDDIVLLPYTSAHLECHLRSALGDVQHLEGRCGTCDNTQPVDLPSDEYATYREGAKATLQWLLDHNRGRFHT